ncbi:MAG: FAD-dependent oxidoreductase [Firmicutes bacterium HGW-Firmicutes-1]|jgi:glycine/D-amino acid oxidase-like deaminating enzyme/nitrite reductase/ring-hydroxylating ferredoxin subunit|nr:MAG: FAD-dependent oxidoreductase [Firmicutes bacterium HGW-Firmicutes-1]
MEQIEHISFWEQSMKSTEYPKLDRRIKVNTAIIGGGIFGLTSALLLMKEGVDVAVFEANKLGSGATGSTTAKVTSQHRLIYQDIISEQGDEHALQYATANQGAIKKIKDIIQELKIDCDYKEQKSYVFATTEKGLKKVQKEYDAAIKLNLPASIVTESSLPFECEAALCFDGQGMFHPLKYLFGISDILRDKKIPVYENTRIIEVDGNGPFVLTTDDGVEVEAEKVIIATKYPILNKKGLLVVKLYVMRTYIVAGYSSKLHLDGMYINAEDPVRSLRSYTQDDKELILVVGASHQTGECKDTTKLYEELIAYAKKLDPDFDVKYKWSTQDCLSLDSIPYIGSLSEDLSQIYVGTGFSKWGMTNGTVAAMIISDFILGRNNPWKEVFDPKRGFSLKTSKELLVQGVDLTGDLIKTVLPVDAVELIDIKKGEGKVIEYNNEKVGVFRDGNGNVFGIDPTCRHLGCQVTFNNAEKTWDCPCHGSRYHFQGGVIEAPAVHALEQREIGESGD